jgi:acyl-CoA synthetase (AMP-forming)/AMP-acid ligase II
VAAVVVARKEVSEQDILEHCRAHLASFKVPKAVHIVSELPKSASGKILKRELRRTYGG